MSLGLHGLSSHMEKILGFDFLNFISLTLTRIKLSLALAWDYAQQICPDQFYSLCHVRYRYVMSKLE